MDASHQKVTASHLSKEAYLYVRQSTLKQVYENTESTRRQYALRDRATALGWPVDQVTVIDDDLGISGASAENRAGFQRLVGEVSLGNAGIVLGLEVSRLARNSSDWHKLLELCALSNTLLLDEDGLYDPSDFNDRLILGMKGTFSEVELHILKARLRGGVLNKARRGELRLGLPTGLRYDSEDRVILDPDEQVRKTIRYLFETFRRTHSACATVRIFKNEGLPFPRKLRTGPRKGEIEWTTLSHSRLLNILHNPRYAGAFAYGRTEHKKFPGGWGKSRKRPMEEWVSLVLDAHDGYITWQHYKEHQTILRDNAFAYQKTERKGPPREGTALLQGLVLCGRCGRRMTLRYHERKGRTVPDYICSRAHISHGEPVCQIVPGAGLDDTISAIIEEIVSEQSIGITIAVQHEVESREQEADELRRQRVERARYETELARERYLCVDPRNRLVADTLERSWNEKLRLLRQVQEEYEQTTVPQTRADDPVIREQIAQLLDNFSTTWNRPSVPNRERKRIVRLIIEDVTVIKDKELREINVHIRFTGGATRSLKLDTPVIVYERWKTKPHIIEEIDRLLDDHTEREIAERLTDRGLTTTWGKPFHQINVAYIVRVYQLRHRRDRLRDRGFLPLRELATTLELPMLAIKRGVELGEVEVAIVNATSRRYYRPTESLLQRTESSLVNEIDHLLDEHTDTEIAEMLNDRGITAQRGGPIRTRTVGDLRRKHKLQPRRTRLLERGFVSRHEMAATLETSVCQVDRRVKLGEIEIARATGERDVMYRVRTAESLAVGRPDSENEVQYA